MATFRVTTYYTASIDTDVITDSKEEAIELVSQTQQKRLKMTSAKPLMIYKSPGYNVARLGI